MLRMRALEQMLFAVVRENKNGLVTWGAAGYECSQSMHLCVNNIRTHPRSGMIIPALKRMVIFMMFSRCQDVDMTGGVQNDPGLPAFDLKIATGIDISLPVEIPMYFLVVEFCLWAFMERAPGIPEVSDALEGAIGLAENVDYAFAVAVLTVSKLPHPTEAGGGLVMGSDIVHLFAPLLAPSSTRPSLSVMNLASAENIPVTYPKILKVAERQLICIIATSAVLWWAEVRGGGVAVYALPPPTPGLAGIARKIVNGEGDS
ncbi:hypothetical protein BD779DRAFT_1478566 [Infundibulicybe gibba]|nr:hypothetical protein BD779DRAFT_1478566 [Infundibulicybe gibba]